MADITPATAAEANQYDNITKLCSTVLDLPPSCIEFSPKNPEYFVVGTYNLEKEGTTETKNAEEDENNEDEQASKEKKSQSRNGGLILFRIQDDELHLAHTVTHPSAILDLHFSPFEPHLLVVASSAGSVSLYELLETPRFGLIHRQTFSIFPESTLVLSLAWNPFFNGLIGATLSTSTVAVMQFNHALTELTLLRSDLSPHSDLEAWTLAFSPVRSKNAGQSIYSGGDDSKLRCITFPSLASVRSSAQDLAMLSPGGTRGMPGHEAGVTAILPLPLDTEPGKDILVTGSYDDNVRVYAPYDYREGRGTKPKVLTELFIGGGVWRLKFLRDYTLRRTRPKDGEKKEDIVHTFRILASCMHAGARVLEVKGSLHGEWTIEILAKFEDHKSMNYGSDVLPVSLQAELETKLDDSNALCVSTSFYDRLLCVWRFEKTSVQD